METIDYKNPRLLIESGKITEGKVAWRSPSNLAIIKYWGKYGVQLPKNPSFSLTLDQAFTETTVYFTPRPKTNGLSPAGNGISLTFFFEDQQNQSFEQKVRKYLDNVVDVFPFLRQLDLVIRSRNSFPHSSGIASSASSMSALALCLCSLENFFFGTLSDPDDFFRKASFLARIGSGSACRSVYAKGAIWGEHGEISGSSNLYAIPYGEELHPVFSNFHDDILIVNRGEKSVSSRAGHQLMDENPFAQIRYNQARQRFQELMTALSIGDVERFGLIAEGEALTLHALMMMSNPPYVLLKPGTVAIIERVQRFRTEKGIPLYFSLDAGPNPHLLYPAQFTSEVQSFIRQELTAFCDQGQWIADGVGAGPQKL